MTTVTAAELAERVQRNTHARLDTATARRYLDEWRDQGIAETIDVRWRLTRQGRAMFGAWAGATDLEDTDERDAGGRGPIEKHETPTATLAPFREQNRHGEARGESGGSA